MMTTTVPPPPPPPAVPGPLQHPQEQLASPDTAIFAAKACGSNMIVILLYFTQTKVYR
jgi:hypothetical protein